MSSIGTLDSAYAMRALSVRIPELVRQDNDLPPEVQVRLEIGATAAGTGEVPRRDPHESVRNFIV